MKYSEEEKAMRLEDWRRSGKSVWAYAKANGLNPQTFAKWTKTGAAEEACFMEVPATVMPDRQGEPEFLIEKGEVKIHIEERKKEASSLLDEFKAWLLKRVNEVPPKTLLGEAINYTLNQWDKLIKYLESPCLTPDNNTCENAIRPFVLGRKNWLFCQSVGGPPYRNEKDLTSFSPGRI